VAEEKSSRVMELMLNAATPGEMLAGKVLGVGGAGLTQLAAIVLPAAIVVALQVPLTRLVLGEDAADTPLAGLTPSILVAFVVFFLLGFLLTALVYAAAGSLVSRQEDVQQVALPMLMISFVAYFAAFFASGAPGAAWVAPLSWVPFFSPYVMLARLTPAAAPAGALAVGLPSPRSWRARGRRPHLRRASCSTASPLARRRRQPRGGAGTRSPRPRGAVSPPDRAVGVESDGGRRCHHGR
jgi:ABC-2 type transport system permease protein